jgi:hypothetical protein
MCVYGRGFSSMRMYVEQRREKHREKKGRHQAATRQTSHGRILRENCLTVKPLVQF